MRDEQGWERMKIMLEEGPQEGLLSVSLAQPSGAGGDADRPVHGLLSGPRWLWPSRPRLLPHRLAFLCSTSGLLEVKGEVPGSPHPAD